MYKSVNISEDTYKRLQRIATQLQKPKAQVVEALVKEYDEDKEKTEKRKLAKFNEEMGAKIRALKFSKDITISTDNIDDDFAALADTEYEA
jgi:hypothetical protein